MRLELYETNDVTLAAYLRCRGYKLKEIKQLRNSNKCLFIFNHIEREEVTDYNQQRTLVEPGSFHAMIRQLTTAAKRVLYGSND